MKHCRSRTRAGATHGALPPSGQGFNPQDLAIFLFVAVPVIGAVLTGILGRKLGSLATGAAAGMQLAWLSASLAVAAGAVSSRSSSCWCWASARRWASRAARGRWPPIIFGGGSGGAAGAAVMAAVAASGGGGRFRRRRRLGRLVMNRHCASLRTAGSTSAISRASLDDRAARAHRGARGGGENATAARSASARGRPAAVLPVARRLRRASVRWRCSANCAWDTEHNNGVLIYLLLAEHRIEIVADRGPTGM